MISRREIIGTLALAGGAAAWPLRAHAQEKPVPVVGFLNNQSAAGWQHLLAAFHQGLHEEGFVVGQNISIEYRWAEGHLDQLPALAADLVARRVNVLVATGGPDPALSAKRATGTIPIVFTTGPDPVGLGLVESLARPGGNITGFTLFTRQLTPKRVELLHELKPTTAPFAVLLNPDNSGYKDQLSDLQQAAEALGRQLYVVLARSEWEIVKAFDNLAGKAADKLLVGSDALFTVHRTKIAALAERQWLPAIYEAREFVEAGGLLSYGASYPDVYYRAGLYTARILKGAKPGDLPVQQPTKLELVINLKTAKALGLAVPALLLGRADQVIE